MVLCMKCVFLLLFLIRVICRFGQVIVSGMLGSLGLVLRLVRLLLVMNGCIVSELSRWWVIIFCGLWMVVRLQVLFQWCSRVRQCSSGGVSVVFRFMLVRFCFSVVVMLVGSGCLFMLVLLLVLCVDFLFQCGYQVNVVWNLLVVCYLCRCQCVVLFSFGLYQCRCRVLLVFGVSCRWCRLNEMFWLCVFSIVFLVYYMWKNQCLWLVWFRFFSQVIFLGWKKCCMIFSRWVRGCSSFRFIFNCMFLFSVISSILLLWFQLVLQWVNVLFSFGWFLLLWISGSVFGLVLRVCVSIWCVCGLL